MRPSLHLDVVAIKKRTFGSLSTRVPKFTFYFICWCKLTSDLVYLIKSTNSIHSKAECNATSYSAFVFDRTMCKNKKLLRNNYRNNQFRAADRFVRTAAVKYSTRLNGHSKVEQKRTTKSNKRMKERKDKTNELEAENLWEVRTRHLSVILCVSGFGKNLAKILTAIKNADSSLVDAFTDPMLSSLNDFSSRRANSHWSSSSLI